MKNIIVLAMGHLSNGEITIAVETLKHIHNNGYNLLFISHQWGYDYIGSFNIPVMALTNMDTKECRKEFLRIVKDFKADAIVCADVTTTEFASTWSGISFDLLKNLGIPVGSFDQYEWESTNFKFDFFFDKAKSVDPVYFKGCDFLIRPCPLNKSKDFDGRVVTCRLFGQNPTPPTMKREEWCDALGLPKDQKVIFTVNSSWELIDVTKFMNLTYIVKWMPRMIYHHILAIKEPLTIVHVGPRPWDFDIHKRITYKYFNRLNADIYQETEKQADLFYGTNATSITLSKAAYSLTPCVLFQNLKKINFDKLADILPQMPEWYREMASIVKRSPTFRIFPWGWTRFLEPVFKDNPYTQAFVEAPVFIPQKCTKILKQLLFDEHVIDQLQARQKQYFEKLNGLAPVEELLEKI
jgi:hypothetical protein